ncbi:hypothetical protein CGZ80_11085 [Rhodopirellula sp. MGV]|nr:hypothetical protein CGZ80_11085 [Rhodopirellula sp. MGV]PNY35658.1 hypothetical protein C2E31_17125 [Rhodopirellula baltica]
MFRQYIAPAFILAIAFSFCVVKFAFAHDSDVQKVDHVSEFGPGPCLFVFDSGLTNGSADRAILLNATIVVVGDRYFVRGNEVDISGNWQSPNSSNPTYIALDVVSFVQSQDENEVKGG